MFQTEITRKGYVVHKAGLGQNTDCGREKILDEIRRELTVRPNVNPNYAVQVDPYPVYRESSTKMYLPRFYGCSKLGPPTRGSIYDAVVEQHHVHSRLETTLALRDYQQPIVDETLRVLRSQGCANGGGGGGVLELYTGSGKTSIAIYIMCALKVKTLIVVHKSFLLQQWVDRIKAQTNAGVRVGSIQGTTFDVADKDVVIGMLQTLSMKDFTRDQDSALRGFGLVVVDETHHIGAEVFCRALPKIASRYMLGLSATPIRKDGLTKVIYWYMGDTAYRLQRDGAESQRVFVKKLVYKDANKEGGYGRECRNFKGVLMLPQMISDIVAHEPRNEVIVREILQYSRTKEPGRQVMVISDRIQHLHHLKSLVDKALDLNQNIKMSTAFYTGQQKQKELQIAEKADVIFSSYAMCREGLDIQSLNTLILATSTGDVVQTCGRILRKVHDVSPFIVDIVDAFSTFATQSKKRDAFYKKSCYAVYKTSSDEQHDILDILTSQEIEQKIGKKPTTKTKTKNTLDLQIVSDTDSDESGSDSECILSKSHTHIHSSSSRSRSQTHMQTRTYMFVDDD